MAKHASALISRVEVTYSCYKLLKVNFECALLIFLFLDKDINKLCYHRNRSYKISTNKVI